MEIGNIKRRFSFNHSLKREKVKKLDSVRSECLDLALFLNDTVPDGDEKDIALERLEEVMFWSNAAIARPTEEESLEL